jgi:hypothetical protein
MRKFPAKKKLRALVPALVLLALPLGVQAQLYTWRDAQGSVIIKNTPPPWYSESERPRGTRVQVLRNGKVIDDTAWPADKRQEGRNKAAGDEAKRAQSEGPSRGPNKEEKEDDDN